MANELFVFIVIFRRYCCLRRLLTLYLGRAYMEISRPGVNAIPPNRYISLLGNLIQFTSCVYV